MAEARLRIPDRISPGDLIVVQSIVAHPMGGSRLRTAEGQPTCYIQEAVVTYDGREVARFEWRSLEARDPMVSFKLKADREAPITLTWRDDCGAVFEKSVEVTFS